MQTFFHKSIPILKNGLATFSIAKTLPPKLLNKVAIITGAAQGIGRESAIRFAQEGVKGLVLADIDEENTLKTLEMVKSLGTSAVFVKTDVSQPADCERMISTAETNFGALHVLFNNAGVMISEDGTEVEVTDEVWNKTFDINVKGVWYGCRFGIPAIRRAGGGSVINTGSFVGQRGAATAQLAYTSSKGAVSAMTRELAILHAKNNIRVNTLCPGPLYTELLMKFLDTDEKKNRRLVHLPMGRFGQAKEMATAAAFLASDESSYITGTDFNVDGGLTAAYVTAE